MKLTAATLAVLGIAAGTELTEALIEEKIVGLNGTITSLKTKVAELEPDAKIGVQTLKEARERAVTLYKAAKGEKSVEAFITGVIEKADLETARAFCIEYQTEVDKTVPLKCTKCGEPVSRQSSQTTEPNQQLEGKRAEDYKLG